MRIAIDVPEKNEETHRIVFNRTLKLFMELKNNLKGLSLEGEFLREEIAVCDTLPWKGRVVVGEGGTHYFKARYDF